MSILNFILIVLIIPFIYIIKVVSNNKNEIKLFTITLFLIYSFFTSLSLYYIQDLYYFYLIYELLNISIYMILLYYSKTACNFKALVYYYFIGFISSLLFISSLYDPYNNNLADAAINISLLIKLGIYPFSEIISKVYKDNSFISYIILNYYVNIIYVVVLFLVNSFNSNLVKNNIIVTIFTIPTIIFCYQAFNKQVELKGASAYSSITNLPLFICTFFSLHWAYNDFSLTDIAKMITVIWMFIIIYSKNTLITNFFAYSLEPVIGKKWLKRKLYFNSLANILSDYGTGVKKLTGLFLLTSLGFPPSILFILKFQIFYYLTMLDNLLFVVSIMIILNTFIVYCYLIIVSRVLTLISSN